MTSSSHSRRGERSSNESGIQPYPRNGASDGCAEIQSLIFERISARPTTPDRLMPTFVIAIDARWLWASMKPGKHMRPFRSMSSVPASVRASALSRVPTWTRSAPWTTAAWAQGCAGSPVQIGPLVNR